MDTIDARSFRRFVPHHAEGRYLVQFPSAYREDLNRSWPLLLFLHGAGERGTDIEQVTRHGPLADSSPDELPFVIVAPQCPAGQWWRPQTVLALLDESLERYRIDADRVYGTGISMGATGLWDAAAERSDRFAAIVPICGRADPLRAPALGSLPVWAIHGAQDAVIPAEQSRTMVEAIRANGGSARLTIDADAGHNVWTDVYADRAVYDWLLSHERTSTSS